MSVDSADVDAVAQEWEIVPTDWWKVSFRRVPWTFPGTTSRQQRSRTSTLKPIATGSGVHARPPHYHDLLYRTRRREWIERVSPTELELSASLPGVRCAEQAVTPYEVDVGIHSLIDSPPAEDRPLFMGEMEEEELALAQKRWNDEVHKLLGGVMAQLSISIDHPSSPGPDSKMWDLGALDSPLSSSSGSDVDQADSELSVESDPLPMTPRAPYSRLPRLFPSDEVAAPHPSKPLNAAAMSFVPSAPTPSPDTSASTSTSSRSSNSDLHSPSPTHEFAFPSLCADNPAASPAARKRSLLLQKDGDGFYHPIDGVESRSDSHTSTRSTTPRRPSADLLPAFLADGASASRTRVRNTSRTREMVERLRSGRWSGKKAAAKTGKDAGESSSAHINTTPVPASQTREKSMEKTAESGTSGGEEQLLEGDGWICSLASDSVQAPRDNGWIVGPPSPPSAPCTKSSQITSTPPRTNGHKRAPKHGHKRSASSTSSLTGSAGSGSSASFSPATSLSSFSSNIGPHTPPSAASAFFPPTPAMPLSPNSLVPPPSSVAQYMQAHIQQVQAQQWQMHARSINAAAMSLSYYSPSATAAMYQPYGPLIPGALPPSVSGQPVMYGTGAKGVGLMGVRW